MRKVKWYKTIEDFVSDLDEVGWFACFSEEVGDAFRRELLSCKIDPDQYYTVPISNLGCYVDFEIPSSYTDWIGDISDENKNVLPIRVVEEKRLPGSQELLVVIEINGKRFEAPLDVPDEWMDSRVVGFLKGSIETACPEFTLTSLNGFESQDQILCIMKKEVILKCDEKGMFPNYENAERDIEKMMEGDRS